MTAKKTITKHYLLASDFDKTLSFNDSGLILAEMLGIGGFEERVDGLSRIHLIQSGGELAYLLLHDPEFRRVRREHLIEVGKRIRLKQNIRLLSQLLRNVDEYSFDFHVISAAPEEVIQSALEGIVPAERIHGTRFRYNDDTGEIESIVRVPAGFGKVAVLEELEAKLQISHGHVVYVGDGSSDIHVMLHVNRRDGLTIAVSETKHIMQIARRTILGEDALNVMVPILEEIPGWDSARIRAFFESQGFLLHEWSKVRTDWITVTRATARPSAPLE